MLFTEALPQQRAQHRRVGVLLTRSLVPLRGFVGTMFALACAACAPAQAPAPAASQSDEYLLFVRWSGLYRMNPNGANVVRLADYRRHPRCSPWGRHDRVHPFAATWRRAVRDRPSGAPARSLARDVDESKAPSISPDGLVAFVSHGTHQLRVVDLVSRQVNTLTQAFDDIAELAWSPDGRRIAFLGGTGRPQGLWTYCFMDRAKGVAETIGPGPFLDRPPMAWSPDGRSLAVVGRGGIDIVDVETRASRSLPRGKHELTEIAWSPDGRCLAILRSDNQCRDRDYLMGNVYVVSLDDGRETKVSNHWPRCRTYESPR